MTKICDKFVFYPLKLIFEASFLEGIIPDSWRKANIVPVHKKDSKIYRAISLLPLFAKIFERIIFNESFRNFLTNELLTNCQSGFLHGDSCIQGVIFKLTLYEVKEKFLDLMSNYLYGRMQRVVLNEQ